MIKGYTLAFKTVTAFIIEFFIHILIFDTYFIPVYSLPESKFRDRKKTLNALAVLGLHFPYIYIMHDRAISFLVATF